ncbi:MAG: efflux RND transporter permease subunit, partial [Bdellovibrionales bacterium]|nr:efflux RND transporter permease subunit [Bdellovibrionales bacterium]
DIDNIDVREVMADLQRAVDRVNDLPPDLRERPRFLEMKSEEFPVVELAIVGSNDSRARDLIADQLKEDLEDIKSILSVRLDGFQKREFNIILNNKKMNDLHIGVDEVIAKISNRNINVPGGALKQTESQELLRIEGRINNRVELENVLIRSNFSGPQIYLKDLARIEDGEEEARILTRYNGQSATLLTVLKKSGADTIAMVKEIDVKISDFKEKYGDGYRFEIFNNESNRVKNRLEVLSSNAISGLVLVILFLMIFLPGKIGFVAALSLPIAVMAALGFMPVFDMNLNAITILALVIALGMMVDNSVVISENFTRLRKSEGLSPKEAALKSIRQLALPISATAFTTIAAFLPMLVTKGIMGQFIKYIPIVVSISLLVSLAESFFLLPMRLVKTSKANDKFTDSQTDWFEVKAVEPFKRSVAWAVRHRYLTLSIFTGLLVLSIVLMTVFNKMVLFPADQTEIYIARIETPIGTRLDSTDARMVEVNEKIKQAMGEHMLHAVTRVGTISVGPADPKAKTGNNVAFVTFYVDEYAKNNIPHTETLEKLRKLTFSSGLEVSFEAMVNGPPVGEAINATFRSNNMKNLEEVVGGVIHKLSAVPGIGDVKVDDVIGDNEVYVDIDYPKADRLGLDVKAIGDTVRAAISGRVVSNVNLNNKKIELKVQIDPESRRSIDDLEQLRIMDKSGNLIPLGSVAKFHRQGGTPQIKRFEFKRSKTVVGDIDPKLITAIEANKKLEEIYREMHKKYKDVSLVFGGEAENTKESMESLWNALGLSLIGIFALLVFMFNSYLRPGVIMTTIPLGLVGFSIAFALHGRPISFLALIGMIGLGGIIVNSGIVLISFIDELRNETQLPLHQVLVEASGLRLRAVVVSSLTTISGLLPTAYGIGGSDAILIPMTLAMAWGLTSGTVLTLIWVPAAYAILEDITHFFSRILGRNKGAKITSLPNRDNSKELHEANP